jgi:S-adenosylmethionine uptake transporter
MTTENLSRLDKGRLSPRRVQGDRCFGVNIAPTNQNFPPSHSLAIAHPMISPRAKTSVAVPFAVACLGLALFSAMDAAMKGVAIAIGAYSAMLWRQVIGTSIGFVPYMIMRNGWPSRAGLRIHLLRGFVASIMAVSFFYGIARVPLAEGIALSFIAPLIALYLSAVVLGERVGQSSIIASLLGLAGVAVLVAARLSDNSGAPRHLDGVASIFLSAVFYAWNIILMRQQALLASPTEVAFFQNFTAGCFLWLALPVVLLVQPTWFTIPGAREWPLLVLAAVLAYCSLALLSWAYARAEAQALVPVEYTAFIWAAIFGAVFYHEAVTVTTVIGTVLIVTGCIIASRGGKADLAKLEAAA